MRVVAHPGFDPAEIGPLEAGAHSHQNRDESAKKTPPHGHEHPP